MKLATHNFLTSRCIKGVQLGYPLIIKATQVVVKESEYDENFLKRMFTKLDYKDLYLAAKSIGHEDDLPPTSPPDSNLDESFLKKFHHVAFEVEVMEGELICPETGRIFPITNGVPNMLLNEHEV